jgi:hypothetical protein
VGHRLAASGLVGCSRSRQEYRGRSLQARRRQVAAASLVCSGQYRVIVRQAAVSGQHRIKVGTPSSRQWRGGIMRQATPNATSGGLPASSQAAAGLGLEVISADAVAVCIGVEHTDIEYRGERACDAVADVACRL